MAWAPIGKGIREPVSVYAAGVGAGGGRLCPGDRLSGGSG